MVAIGDIVVYRLSDADLRRVDAQRRSEFLVGDQHQVGTVVPLIVTNVADGGTVSGQAVLWGNDELAVRGAAEGDEFGEWRSR